MGNCSGPKSRRSLLFLSLFFLFFYLAMPGGNSQLHGSRQWGLLSLCLCTKMGAIRNSPCLSSHDSCESPVCQSEGCSFLVYSCRSPEGKTRLRWRLEVCFYSSNQTTNSAELRIHLTHNYMPFHTEWCFSQARMFQRGNGHWFKILELSYICFPAIAENPNFQIHFIISVTSIQGSRSGDENYLLSSYQGCRFRGRHMVRFEKLVKWKWISAEDVFQAKRLFL